MKRIPVLLSIISSICCAVSAQQVKQQPSQSRPIVLVTASNEIDSSASVSGAVTAVGPVAVGTAGAHTSTYEHSEVWEVVRRFNEECPTAVFVTNPETAHSLTIHTDYQKVNSGVMGTVILYQLSLLDHASNPLYVSKKNWLRREIKPICKIIQQQ